jgi:hypothetical protein
MSTEKSGVSVSPSTTMRSRTPEYVPREDSVPAIALDRIEIGIVEQIVAAEWRVARIVRVPGTKHAAGRDHSARLRIGEHRFKGGSATIPETLHHEVMDLEHARQLAGVARYDFQPCFSRDNVLDHERRGRGSRRRARFAGG